MKTSIKVAGSLDEKKPTTLADEISSKDETIRKKLSKFEKVGELGEGASAIVIHCKYLSSDGKNYAIKIMSRNQLKHQREMGIEPGIMFRGDGLSKVKKEIAIMKKLIHPNVVKLEEVIDDENFTLLILEYVIGGALMEFDAINREYRFPIKRGKVSIEIIAEFFIDILAGLQFLHLNKVIHRDLKPENILVDGKGVAKLADFGVAHIFTTRDNSRRDIAQFASNMKSMGKVSDVQGTICFWSPEACEGDEYNGYKADIWALGVILWAMVLNRLPFDDECPINIFSRIVTQELEFPAGLSPELVDLLRGLLEKDPKKRMTLDEAEMNSWTRDLLEPVKLVRMPTYKVICSDQDFERAITKSKKGASKFQTIESESFRSREDDMTICQPAERGVSRKREDSLFKRLLIFSPRSTSKAERESRLCKCCWFSCV